ncbi:hypothetical protein C8F01DRAFT_997400, partial [Mycena amicta]
RSDIWFDDGSLVVEAESTQFRVFRGALEYHAPGIKELLDDPQRDALQVDGTPVLVPSDSAADLEHVLRKLFYHSYPDSEPLQLEVILAFARIGKKYGMDMLFNNAVTRLTAVFPATLDAWMDAGQRRARAAVSCNTNSWVRYECAVATLILARKLDIQRLLPQIFLYFSYPNKFGLLLSESAAAVADKDKATILAGFQRRLRAHRNVLFDWLEEDPACFLQGEECRVRRLEIGMTIWRPDEAGASLAWKKRWGEGLCRTCQEAAKTSHELGAKAMWDGIPAMFNLPPWEELLAEDTPVFT